jgi:hypothetical protein
VVPLAPHRRADALQQLGPIISNLSPSRPPPARSPIPVKVNLSRPGRERDAVKKTDSIKCLEGKSAGAENKSDCRVPASLVLHCCLSLANASIPWQEKSANSPILVTGFVCKMPSKRCGTEESRKTKREQTLYIRTCDAETALAFHWAQFSLHRACRTPSIIGKEMSGSRHMPSSILMLHCHRTSNGNIKGL